MPRLSTCTVTYIRLRTKRHSSCFEALNPIYSSLALSLRYYIIAAVLSLYSDLLSLYTEPSLPNLGRNWRYIGLPLCLLFRKAFLISAVRNFHPYLAASVRSSFIVVAYTIAALVASYRSSNCSNPRITYRNLY